MQRGPWPEVGERAGGAGRFPAVSLAGGEGNGVEEQERTKLYPMVVFLGLGVAGLGVPRGAVAPAATASGGGGVPVRQKRRGVVGELHRDMRELLVGSI